MSKSPMGMYVEVPGGLEVKPACGAGQVRSLEKTIATHSSIHLEIPWTERLAGYSPWGCKKLDPTEQLTLI